MSQKANMSVSGVLDWRAKGLIANHGCTLKDTIVNSRAQRYLEVVRNARAPDSAATREGRRSAKLSLVSRVIPASAGEADVSISLHSTGRAGGMASP